MIVEMIKALIAIITFIALETMNVSGLPMFGNFYREWINKNFERKNFNIFLAINLNMFWVQKRTVSLRQFFCVPKTYVLVAK